MSASDLKPGDRVVTPTGKVGTVVEPPWLMPEHELVALDQGGKTWLLRYLILPLSSNLDDA